MNPELQLLLWITGSFAIGLTAIALTYPSGDSWLRRALTQSELGELIAEVVTFLYYIGLPFLALSVGAVSVDLLCLGAIGIEDAPTLAGFTPQDWISGSITASLATGFMLVMLWLTQRTGSYPLAPSEGQPKLLMILRNAAYAEAHWAFYRGPFVLLLQDTYWGAAVGFCLIAVEWVLIQRLRDRSWRIGRPETLLMTCCAITSGLLYLTTRNLWLMIAAHTVIQWSGRRLLAVSRLEYTSH